MEQMKESEKWSIVKGFENYEVSTWGNLRDIDKKILLKPSCKNISGYYMINLYSLEEKKSKFLSIHSIVAKTFISNLGNLPEVDHKNDNNLDNYYKNLQWVTKSYNVLKSFKARRKRNGGVLPKIRPKPVAQLNLKGEYINSFCSVGKAAKFIGRDYKAIFSCCEHRTFTSKGYKWLYLEEYCKDKGMEMLEFYDKEKKYAGTLFSK